MKFHPKFKYSLKKLDKILVALATVGVIFIGVCDYFLWFNLSADTKVNSIILWLTSIVIIKYTVETYDLRITTEKEVKVQEEIMMNEFLPIIFPSSGMIQNRLLHLDVRNAGNGLAKGVDIRLNSKLIAEGISIIGRDGITRDFLSDDILEISGNARIEKIKLRIDYKDIYNRKFATVGSCFYRDQPAPYNRFQLLEGGWEFNNISTGVK